MDNEQFERYKEFILQQQAQFATKIGQLEDGLTRLVGVVERLAQVTAERFESVEKQGDETDRKIAALVDSQIQTEESLRNLSATVDRHINEGHNGRARKED